MSYSIMGALREGSVAAPVVWRGLGALVLGVMLAHWTWILFAPRPTVVAAVAERGAAEEAAHLFGQAVSANAAASGMALPNVKLVGVFAGGAGQAGFAILKLDDKRQLGVAVGEEVASGIRLVEVHPDFVLLDRAGVRQQVDMEQKAKNISAASSVPMLNGRNGIRPGMK